VDLIDTIARAAPVAAIAEAAAAGRHIVATGAIGSSTSLTAAAVARSTGRPVVLVVAHLDESDEILDELASAGAAAVRLAGLEVLPGETNVSVELFAERLAAVRAVIALSGAAAAGSGGVSGAPVIICSIQALMQAVPAPSILDQLSIVLRRGETHDLSNLVRWLDRAGYKRLDAAEEPGDFAVRGGILDIFPAGIASAVAAAGSGGGGGGASRKAAPSQPGTTGAVPVRIDFFGDQIDRITEVDPETMGSDRELEQVELVCANPDAGRARGSDDSTINFLTLIPPHALAMVSETLEVTEQGRGYYERVSDPRGIFGPPAVFKLLKERFAALAEVNQFSAGAATADVRLELPVAMLPAFSQDAAEAIKELGAMTADHRVVVSCQNPGELQRFQELTVEFAPAEAASIESELVYIHRGFIWTGDEATPGAKRRAGSDGRPLAVVPYHELLHRFHTRRRAVRLRAGRAMDTFLDIQPGDYVVHVEHGIARFAGLKVMKPPRHRQVAGGTEPGLLPAGLRQGAEDKTRIEPQEYLTLEFAGNTKLHVPAMNIDQVQKYIGGMGARGKPQLSTLGGQRWKAQKEKVAESVKDLAAEMLRVRAAREHMPGIRYPADTAWQKEFEAEFPYEETEDQLATLVEIKKDMQSPRPMDRLVCGDVGFGKTELAIRAAFKAVEFGRQVAVLVPTTVLAEQHERTFRSRYSGYPFRIESVSRFKSDKDARAILEALRKGHVDVIIGTHRLLSQDVKFADLGLVVIDEEQRFGVEHKERLLRLRLTVDVLTLSATPIPRTLHMAMLGLRDISSLTTPPLDRRAIVTEVIPYNQRRLEQAIARELAREGQVYYVHNRVHDIRSVADDVQRLAPGARIVVGHGQMNPHELEDVMLKFMRRQADILVSTTIIESGIDIATANTMIIDNADRFGLAELHQLRGRVGRYKHRAYCYLLLPADRPVKEVAQKRLKAIEQYSMLGAGFKIAMRDLEIRGAGNLLGAEQSGHIAAVGYEMYCQLLDEAVRDLKSEGPEIKASQTTLDIGIFGSIPRQYIPSDLRRLEAYRRIATARTPAELEKVALDLKQAYGAVPSPVQRLLDLAELRILLAMLFVRTVAIRGQDVMFRTDRPAPLAERLRSSAAESTKSAPAPGSARHFLQQAQMQQAPSVRVLPPPTGEKLHEVYYRPPPNYLEPETLLAVLRRRLAMPSIDSPPSAS
jgi:transcription-repair coupling factor (superfamily II helicase)